MKNVTVNIYGEDYTVKAGEDPQYVEEVAAFVDGKMREITASGKVVATSKIAILTALNIADELFRERKQRKDSEEETDRRITKLLGDLQGVISK